MTPSLPRRSAACLLGLDGFREGPLQFLVPRRARDRQTVGEVHSSKHVNLIDQVEVDGFQGDSPARTIVDLASEVPMRELENAIDSSLRLGWTSEPFLRRRLADLRHRGREVPRPGRVLDGAGRALPTRAEVPRDRPRRGLPKPMTPAHPSPRPNSVSSPGPTPVGAPAGDRRGQRARHPRHAGSNGPRRATSGGARRPAGWFVLRSPTSRSPARTRPGSSASCADALVPGPLRADHSPPETDRPTQTRKDQARR